MPNPMVAVAGSSVLGGLMSNDDDQQVTTQQQLPSFLQPYAPLYAQMGYDLSQQPYQAYPWEQVAPFTQDQNAAMDAVRARATAGSPLVDASKQQTMSTIQGDYLNPGTNPYLQQTYDLAADRMGDAFAKGTAAQTDATFARSRAFGGSAWEEAQQDNQQAFGDALGMMGANLFGGNYAQERDRQQRASMFAPNLAAQDYRDADALLNIGGMQQGLGQQYIGADMNQFNQAAQWPYQQFNTFGQLFNPNLGSQSSQTMPGVGPASGLLGGAIGGLGVYNAGQQAGVWGSPSLLGSATQTTPISYGTQMNNMSWL